MSNSLKKDESSIYEPSESYEDRSDTLEIFKSSLYNCSIFGGNVRQEICSPLSIHFLDLKRISIYLLTNFAAEAVVGHNIVDILSLLVRYL